MTEREKIIDVLNKNFTQDVECTPIYTTAQGKEVALPQELCDIFNDIVTQAVIPYFADALIAAGIGDVSKLKNHRVIAEYSLVPDDDNPYIIPNVPLRVTQLYSGEEVEKMAKERKELKDELRSKVEYIHEQDEVIKEYKHRAEVAERALLHALETAICDGQCPECDIKFAGNCKGTDKDIRDCAALDVEDYLQQAEKELAEEGKDENY